MKIIGRGRYATDTYPDRSNAIPAEVRFTPAFQSTNGDASLGDSGIASGSYAVIGKLLYVTGFFVFGTGVTVGTGALLLPFPPGFSPSSVDNSATPKIGGAPGITESETQTITSGTLAGNPVCLPSVFILETDDVAGTVLEAEWGVDLTGIQSGDSLQFTYVLPFK
jgi:hypothetical protein